MGEVPLTIPSRGNPPGPHSGEDQARDDRLVTIAGNEQPAVLAAGRRPSLRPSPITSCRRWRRRRPPRRPHRPLIPRPAPGTSREPIGRRVRRWRARRRGTGPYQHRQDTLVSTFALPMPRRGETVAVTAVVVDERVQQGCLRMIHARPGTPKSTSTISPPIHRSTSKNVGTVFWRTVDLAAGAAVHAEVDAVQVDVVADDLIARVVGNLHRNFSSRDSWSSASIQCSGGSTTSSPSSLRTSSESRLSDCSSMSSLLSLSTMADCPTRQVLNTVCQLIFGIGMPSLAVNCASS